MPYLGNNERRKEMDRVVDLMRKLKVKADGDLNYILFKYCLYYVERRYNTLKNYLAELNESAEEIRRRVLAPYEDQQAMINGEVQ